MRDLAVSACGRFGGEPMTSTGIVYESALAGDVPQGELGRLVDDCEAVAAIPDSLRSGAEVRARSVAISGSA